jgi:hypothetical protein
MHPTIGTSMQAEQLDPNYKLKIKAAVVVEY